MKKHYYGVHGSARAWVAGTLLSDCSRLILMARDRKTAEELFEDAGFFVRSVPVLHYPAWETLPFEPVSPPVDISSQRLSCLATARALPSFLLVTSVEAAMQKVIPSWITERVSFVLEPGMQIDRAALPGRFQHAGFREVSVVENTGDMATRGGVLDFFPAMSDRPVRLELYPDGTIGAIRFFDADSQRSAGECGRVTVTPVREFINFHAFPELAALLPAAIERIKSRGRELEVPPREIAGAISAIRHGADLPGIELIQAIGLERLDTFFDCLPDGTRIVSEDQISIQHSLDAFSDRIGERETRFREEHQLFPGRDGLFMRNDEFLGQIEEKYICSINHFDLLDDAGNDTREGINLNSTSNVELSTNLKTLVGTGRALKPLKAFLGKWRGQGFTVAFVVGSLLRAERLQQYLLSIETDARILEAGGLEWAGNSSRNPVAILQGHLNSGFKLPGQKVIFISENEIFPEKSYRKGQGSKSSLKRILNSLSQLQADDFIVHTDYGIGIYRGLKHLEIEGVQGDFLQIEYADSQLYLPVQNISKVQKFFAAEGQRPVIDKLGSSRWTKTKLKVRQSVIALAGDLLKLYAARSVARGWRFEPYGAEDDRFAEGFPYNETPDQMKAILEVLSDMAGERPMDRLVCGDVGFGKTEVALRAAYKCTQHGRQVAILVPTTILVEQHHAGFQSRFADYPVKTGAVSRFYGPKKNKETLQALASGDIDIIVGTHRLLQKDVMFKDLGLVIIDEEHRFGVQQKERLKQIKTQVDVLSLTATPIPRTLHMSLLDIRDTSVINTPPQDRKAIRTYAATYNDTLVRDAILREIQRGGQCFFLHNRVQSIDLLTSRLSELVPEARFEYAHGQMSETQLESIMQRFLSGGIDVLVSTTIIESGLDIPNANTIIIERADAFGLAQLYQLRGRVGRGNRQAYAYFLIPKSERISIDAQKRLRVLQSLDDLGLGFNLAIRDLEIRGAGNLLGREQSGSVLAVGFELYSKILKEAVHNLKGEDLPVLEAIDPEIKLGVSAYIPEFYIPDVSERLVMYQRLAGLLSYREADELAAEISDRFGTMPAEVVNLVEVMRFRSLLRRHAIVKGEVSGGTRLLLSFSPQARIDADKVIALVKSDPERYRFSRSMTLSVTFEEKELKDLLQLYFTVEKLLNSIASAPAAGAGLLAKG